jgi:hypothetical protein
MARGVSDPYDARGVVRDEPPVTLSDFIYCIFSPHQ